MSVSKANRVLIAINHLASGETDYLYRSIEETGRGTIQATLRDDYERIVRLYDHNATLAKLLEALRKQGRRTSIQRIDLLVMLHGYPGEIEFRDGRKSSRQVGTDIAALNLRPKLRMLYNTSCYGDSHSMDFLNGGFDAAIGAKKVNANAAVEFPLLLSLWQFNNKLSDCLAPSIPLTAAADAAARAYGRLTNAHWKNDVNSTKVLRGNGSIRIST